MAGCSDVSSASIVKGTLSSTHFWQSFSSLWWASWRSNSSCGVSGSGFSSVWYRALESEKIGKVLSFHGRLKEGSLYCHLSKSLTLLSRRMGHIAVIFAMTKLTCRIREKEKKEENYTRSYYIIQVKKDLHFKVSSGFLGTFIWRLRKRIILDLIFPAGQEQDKLVYDIPSNPCKLQVATLQQGWRLLKFVYSFPPTKFSNLETFPSWNQAGKVMVTDFPLNVQFLNVNLKQDSYRIIEYFAFLKCWKKKKIFLQLHYTN